MPYKDPEKAKEANHRYRVEHREELREKKKQYRLRNKDKIKEKKRLYYLKNKEKIDARNKEWNRKNKERIADYQKEYAEENKRKISAYHKKWYKKNRERLMIQHKEWRENNPDYFDNYNKEHKERNKRYNHSLKGRVRDKKIKAKRRALGFIPLNEPFPNCEAHHINLEHIIYIPKELHQSIKHNIWTGENINKINLLAIDFLIKQKGYDLMEKIGGFYG